MGKILLFGAVLLVFGCNKKTISQSDLQYLNGYWEIQEVAFPDGTKKNFEVNPTIDFIQLKDNQGIRKKMQPKFDGTYLTSNQTEPFEILRGNESFLILYNGSSSQREETLVHLDSISFMVTNEEGIHYTYSRFQPIQIPK